MNRASIARRIFLSPQFRTIQYQDDVERQEAINLLIDETVEEVATKSDWSFLLVEGSKATTAGTSDYVLEGGSNQDGRRLINLTYGSGRRFIQKYDIVDVEYILSDVTDPSQVIAWAQIGEDGGFPKVRLFGTPSTADTIYYRMLKKNVKIEDWPEEWGSVIVYGVLSRIDMNFRPMYMDAIAEMRQRYEVAGWSQQPPFLDNDVTSYNYAINAGNGYAGNSTAARVIVRNS